MYSQGTGLLPWEAIRFAFYYHSYLAIRWTLCVLCIVSHNTKGKFDLYKLGIAKANAIVTLFACVRNFYGKNMRKSTNLNDVGIFEFNYILHKIFRRIY